MADSVPSLSIGQCATMACMLEATAAKPGNVHRGADFDDLTYLDLLMSGVAIAPAMEAATSGTSVGKTILDAVRSTRTMVDTNSNLGIVLLLAPLASVPRQTELREGVEAILGSLTSDDARNVYAAIALAQPGGLGEVNEHDVSGAAPDDLLAAMRAGAERDLVARQYAENFATVLGDVVPLLAEGAARGWPLLDTIVRTHVTIMSRYPDSLIARKLGAEEADKSSAWAARVLESGEPGDIAYIAQLADFDFWLRSKGHQRNPGTTADLITAGLFAALRDGGLRGEGLGSKLTKG